MPVVIDNQTYDLLPSPSQSSYAPSRKAPKVKFQAEAGYTHQRERYPFARRSFPMEWPLMTLAQKNLLEKWLDYIGSESFYFVDPQSLLPRPDGSIVPAIHLCRVVDEETVIKPHPRAFRRFTAKITVEEL